MPRFHTSHAIVVLSLFATIATAQDKPNIVDIMTDNQGYGDLEVYCSIRAETPKC